MKTVVLWATFGDDIKSLIRESDPADRRGGLACDALRSTMTSLLSVEVSDRAVCSIARRRMIQCHHLNATLRSSLNCSQVIKQRMMSTSRVHHHSPHLRSIHFPVDWLLIKLSLRVASSVLGRQLSWLMVTTTTRWWHPVCLNRSITYYTRYVPSRRF